MKRIELLAPAGDLEKLKIAVTYGADAVFIGGHEFSLRSKASNFTIEEIKEGCDFAHKFGTKVHVTCNIVMHEKDVEGLKDWLISLDNAGVDAIITSSLYMVSVAKKYTNLECHISTQQSILNHETVNFFYEHGADRVVLGRECSLDNIRTICNNKPCEIETFIHGSMCSSYSGKCMLSNVMVNRDANRGGCAFSCRWKYNLYDGDKVLFNNEDYLSISSKDLCAIREIPSLIEAGVDSLKIEGRRKSATYIACVVKAYRQAIDDYYAKKELDFNKYEDDILKVENRITSIGFLHGNVTTEQMLFDLDSKLIKAGDFVGIVMKTDENYTYVKLKNKIKANSDYLVFSPHNDDSIIHISELRIINRNGNVSSPVEEETVANTIVLFKVNNQILEPYTIIRLIKE